MKRAFFTLVYTLVFYSVFLTGFLFGVFFRSSPAVAVSDQREDVCTCAPCLPDTWCKKCKHKSRDCPKLSWYFHPKTNISFRLTSPLKRGGAGGVISSNVVLSSEGIAP